MLKRTTLSLGVAAVLGLALMGAPQVRAQGEPTMHQVYEAAQSGHLDQAQQMMDRVLRDHPTSAKAHYVQAELSARAGNLNRARQELGTAERLAPGLPFAPPEGVRVLQRQLTQGAQPRGWTPVTERRSAFPWGWVLLLGVGGVLVWTILRRRATAQYSYPQYQTPVAPAGMPGYGGAGVAAPPMGGGMGSGIVGGLATGLAVGAGVAAGEALVRNMMDRHEGAPVPASQEVIEPPQNTDMGGNDFGFTDTSWDDGGGSFGGDGGGDWT